MAQVGVAYVEIKPDLRKFSGQLKAGLERRRAQSEKAGDEHGKSYGTSFSEGAKLGVATLGGRFVALVGAFAVAAAPLAAVLSQTAAAATAAGTAIGTGLAGGVGAATSAVGALVQTQAAVKLGMVGVTDAVKEQAKVYEQLAGGVKPTKAETDKLAQSLARLAPSARTTVKAIAQLSARFDSFRQSVQEQLFAGVADEINRLAKTVLPVLEVGLTATASAVNIAARETSKYLASAQGISQVSTLMSNNTAIVTRLGQAMGPLVSVVLRLLSALSPLGMFLADVVVQFATWADAALAAGEKSGGLAKGIDTLQTALGLLISIGRNVSKALGNVFTAAAPAGLDFLRLLNDLTTKFASWTGSAEGQNKIAEWAEEGIVFLHMLKPLFDDVQNMFSQLASSGDSQALIDGIRALVPPLTDLLVQLSAPATIATFSNAFAQLAQVFADMNAGGALAAFINTLGQVMALVVAIAAAIPGGTSVLAGFAATLGTLAAVKFTVGTFLGFVNEAKSLVNTTANITGLTRGLTDVDGKAITATGALSSFVKEQAKLQGALAVDKVKAAGSAMADFGSKTAGAMSQAGTSIANFASSAGSALANAGRSALAAGANASRAALGFAAFAAQQVRLGATILLTNARIAAQAVVTAVVSAATKTWTAIQWLLNIAMSANPLGIVIALIVVLVGAIVLLYTKSETARNIINAAFRAILEVALWVWNLIYTAIRAYIELIIAVVTGIVRFLGDAWDTIRTAVVNAFRAIVRFLQQVWQDIRNGVQSGIDAVIRFFSDLPGKIMDAIGDLGNLLVDTAGDLIDGFVNGIRNGWDRVTEFLTGLIAKLPAPLRKVLEAFSPSRVFARLGETIPQGMALGIIRESGQVAHAISGMVSLPEAGRSMTPFGDLGPAGATTTQPAFEVRVYIGDTELRELVDVEVVRIQDLAARDLIAGRRAF